MIRFKHLFLIALAFICTESAAQKGYLLSKNYSMKILGTSNLHNWSEAVGGVTGYVIVSWNSDGSFDLDAAQITINVDSIKGESSIMTNKTLKALKADSNPKINLTLTAPAKAISASAVGVTISTKCKLSIAGVTKPVNLQLKISSSEKGKLEIAGSQVINMPEYNIRPPTAFFGALKTGNDITLNFNTTFVLSN